MASPEIVSIGISSRRGASFPAAMIIFIGGLASGLEDLNRLIGIGCRNYLIAGVFQAPPK